MSTPTRNRLVVRRLRLGMRRRSAGFSLVEVLVALVVCSVGLLGLAKMESLALASTSVAGTRSIVATQAASLAAMMHANRGYWASGFALASTTVLGVTTGAPGTGTYTISNSQLTGATTCVATGVNSCQVTPMAAYDLQQWSTALLQVLPNYLTTINCSIITSTPVTCTIQIQWAENAVAMNTQQSGATGNITALGAPTYVLYVQP
jgi:type IV pilus assembly protein PilV